MAENGAQLLARLDSCPGLRDVEPRLFRENGPGAVVEVYGAVGTGKTELLYHLVCRCVLPVSSGGLETDAVFVDTDYSLDLLRLVDILDHRLSAAGGSDESVLRECLSRLLVVTCCSSSQLLLTLHYLDTSLSTRPCLLLIDSISAFYWLERSPGAGRPDRALGSCVELLGRMTRDYKTNVVASCHSTRRVSQPGAACDPDGTFLGRSWQQLVSRRLTCSRLEPPAARGQQSQMFSVQCASNQSVSFCVTDRGVHFL